MKDSLRISIDNALDQAMKHQGRLGEVFTAINDKFFDFCESELTLEFPDDEETAHLIIMNDGQGEPTGYSARIDQFDSALAAQAALDMVNGL